MDGEHQSAAIGGDLAQHLHDLAGLPEGEPIEGLFHQQDHLRGQERERQHQAAGKALGESAYPLAQDRLESNGPNDTNDLGVNATMNIGEETDQMDYVLVVPGTKSV